MNPVLFDVKNVIVPARLAYFLGDSPPNPYNLSFALSISELPETPDNCLALIDSPGKIDLISFDKTVVAKEYFRVIGRSLTYLTGYSILQTIEAYLNAYGKHIVSGQSYGFCGFYQETPIYGLNKDKNNRFLFSLNYSTMRT